jgi:hypothetical protein
MNNGGGRRQSFAEYWNGGQPLEAGRLIFENLPAENRPKWASRVLRLVLDKSRIGRSRFEEVLRTAEQPNLWGNGAGQSSVGQMVQ